MNYRGIAISILDGSTYDVVEFRDFYDIILWARTITRWDIHCFAVSLENDIPFAMSTIIVTGAKNV